MDSLFLAERCFRSAKRVVAWVAAVGLIGCATIDDADGPREAPTITSKTPLPEAIDAALTFGDQTLVQTKRTISRRRQWPKTAVILRQLILKNHEDWSSNQLVNAFALYQASGDPKASEVFEAVSRSDRRLGQQLGWYLASQLPSKPMADRIEARLTAAVVDNDLADLYVPYLADAIAANGLRDSYTIVRQGLFVTNHVAFARSMARLDAKAASRDFLGYLALAPIEELRQLNMKTVDVLACTEILTHMIAYPPSLTDVRFPVLFHFSVSRNTALAEMARKVLENYIPEHGQVLASMLIKLPAWMQLAYIERVRRQYSTSDGLFLQEVRKLSAQKDVIDELDRVIR